MRASFTDDAGNEQSLTSALARSERPYGLNASETDGAVVRPMRTVVKKLRRKLGDVADNPHLHLHRGPRRLPDAQRGGDGTVDGGDVTRLL